jgi:hypothetical protein
MRKAVLVTAALLLAPSPALSQEAQRSEGRDPPTVERDVDSDARGERLVGPAASALRYRMVRAIETVESACAEDIDDFCAKVMPGAGRLSLCMRAHEDQLSRACRSALEQVSQPLQRNVERVTEMCWHEVGALCGDVTGVGQCVAQKKASLSAPCRTIVTILGQKVQGLMARVGMPVYSSDDKALGQVAQVVRGADGKVQSVQVDIGRMLGLGTKVVAISADKFELLSGIKLQLSDAEIRSLPEARQQ